MDALWPLAEPAPDLPSGARHAVLVVDPKTKQGVMITSEEKLVAYSLDDEARVDWNEGEPHTDAVVIATWRGEPAILFVELTQSVQLGKPKASAKGRGAPTDPMLRKVRQIDGVVAHFHPSERTGGGRSHGDDHHDAWIR